MEEPCKACRRCGEVKPLSLFHKHPKTRDGRNSECKACFGERLIESRRDPAKYEIWKGYQRKHHLKRLYGITPERYDEMLAEQNGGCAICGQSHTGGRGVGSRLAVDHDADTGRVRGLLCTNCNNGIGRFKHQPDLLRKAIAYLL